MAVIAMWNGPIDHELGKMAEQLGGNFRMFRDESVHAILTDHERDARDQCRHG